MIDPRELANGEEGDVDRAMTPEQRLAIFLSLCELTDSIIRGRPEAEALRAPTPRSAESEALWKRLMERRER